MRTSNHCAILAIMAISSLVATQEVTHAPIKTKNKFDKTVSADKSKPIRHALEEQYDKIRKAELNRDVEGILELRTPGFQVHMPNGQVWDFEASREYIRRGFEQVQTNIDMRLVIGEIDVDGDSAAAQIEQHWSRMQLMKGKLRRVDTSAVQRETWIKTPSGWKLNLIDNIHPGAWYVDGKRVDPTKPYDPDAAPFVPPPA